MREKFCAYNQCDVRNQGFPANISLVKTSKALGQQTRITGEMLISKLESWIGLHYSQDAAMNAVFCVFQASAVTPWR